MNLALSPILIIIGLILIYVLTPEKFENRQVGAKFPGDSYLTFKKAPTEDFDLEVTFQTLDDIGGVLYAEKYTSGNYYLCIEYKQLVFYVVQINPQSIQRLVLENNLTRGVRHKITLKDNGNTLFYEERGMSYPFKALPTVRQEYYVGGPTLSLIDYIIPAFKGCMYSLKGPNGYVNFPVDHPKVAVGHC